MVELAIVWFIGVIAYYVVENPWLNRMVNNIFVFSISLLCLFSTVVVSNLKLANGWIGKILMDGTVNEDCLVGLFFAGTIPFLKNNPLKIGWYKSISTWLSKISYTFYVVHYPIMVFFFYTFVLPNRSVLTLSNFFMFFVCLLVLLLYAWGVWYLFERRTGEIRNFLMNFIHRSKIGSRV